MPSPRGLRIAGLLIVAIVVGGLGLSTLQSRAARPVVAPPVATIRQTLTLAQIRRTTTSAGMTRAYLASPPPALTVTIPDSADARLEIAFSVSELAWRVGLKQVDFVATLQSGAERIEILRKRLDASAGGALQEMTVPLAHLRGRQGELRLQTEVVADGPVQADLLFWTPPVFRPQPRDERPNILLFSIDTLRPDHLGCYGYERDTSPTIDRLAGEGVRFSQAISSSSWTLPAHASMLTGLDPVHHGANRFSTNSRIAAKADTLAELLWKEGYATAGFTDGGFVSALFGFDRGFDVYVSGSSNKEAANAKNFLSENVDKALRWIHSTAGQPFFLFLHTYAVHLPYAPEPPYDRMFTDPDYTGPCKDEVTQWAERTCFAGKAPDTPVLENVKALYDGEIRSMDAMFSSFLGRLDDAGVLDNTCIIITSDHGEEFNEHGRFFHKRADLYDELIRVPLIAWCPKRFAGDSTVDEQVSLTDITPTILQLAGAPLPATLDGTSLLAAIHGHAAPKSDAVVSEVDGSIEKREGVTVAVRTERYKLMAQSDSEALRLFDLEEDPGETENLSASHTEVASQLRGSLASSSLSSSASVAAKAPLPAPASSRPALDPAIEERLRALGYVE